MLQKQLQDLAKAKAQIAELESKISQALPGELAKIPAIYGFPSAKAFLKAFKAALKSSAGKKTAKPAKKAKKAKAPAAKKGRKRARITDEIKSKVKELVLAGKSGSEIVKTLGISLPSIQNIKKELGLVKARAAAPQQVTPPPAEAAPSAS